MRLTRLTHAGLRGGRWKTSPLALSLILPWWSSSWGSDRVISSNAGSGTAQTNVYLPLDLHSFQVGLPLGEGGRNNRPQQGQSRGFGEATVSEGEREANDIHRKCINCDKKAANDILNHICHSWHSSQYLPFLCRATRFNPICPLNEVKVEW